MPVDPEVAWVEGYVTALDEVRVIVNELLVRADSCIRGGKASSYLRELIRRWPIPDEPECERAESLLKKEGL